MAELFFVSFINESKLSLIIINKNKKTYWLETAKVAM